MELTRGQIIGASTALLCIGLILGAWLFTPPEPAPAPELGVLPPGSIESTPLAPIIEPGKPIEVEREVIVTKTVEVPVETIRFIKTDTDARPLVGSIRIDRSLWYGKGDDGKPAYGVTGRAVCEVSRDGEAWHNVVTSDFEETASHSEVAPPATYIPPPRLRWRIDGDAGLTSNADPYLGLAYLRYSKRWPHVAGGVAGSVTLGTDRSIALAYRASYSR